MLVVGIRGKETPARNVVVPSRLEGLFKGRDGWFRVAEMDDRVDVYM